MMNQGAAAKLLDMSDARMGVIKKGGNISLYEAIKLAKKTKYTLEEIEEFGGWFCIQNGLNVKDGRTR